MNAVFFLLAVLTVGSLVMIGYAIVASSLLGVILSILGVLVFMGLGFTLKRRVQTN
ncbi:DUF5325 family protein [Pullulanibacillus sp. KACC 23026]|uniref:DUF5325 family protein n=1 Tax=Pullulanibacillus sp. KACC 23026 TaxID=3028315 RepID=UPI0023AF1DEB|nr:DUF5325 family protein [Pullulanibacillus sp. KACC 23026]WEG11716.1 DUF5325 family protein [Pullulanibacillus sp. KACC 23026]